MNETSGSMATSGAVVDPDLLKFQSQQKKSGTGLDGFHMLSRVQCSGAVQGGSVISQMWRPFWRLQPTRVITGLFRHRHVVCLSHAGGRSGSRLVSGPLVLSPARSWVAPPTKVWPRAAAWGFCLFPALPLCLLLTIRPNLLELSRSALSGFVLPG